MDAMEAILSRRSTRKYKPEAVPKELMDELLNAAMNAPSAGNEQPWYFIVIQNRKILDEIPKFHPFANCLKESPQAIVVCADLKLLKHPEPWWAQDCSAATENILIAAYAKGLGARWVGVYPIEDRINGMKELLGLPQEIIPVCIVAIGYPAEKTPFESRYQSSRVRYNRW
jgi:nitroreductase